MHLLQRVRSLRTHHGNGRAPEAVRQRIELYVGRGGRQQRRQHLRRDVNCCCHGYHLPRDYERDRHAHVNSQGNVQQYKMPTIVGYPRLVHM